MNNQWEIRYNKGLHRFAVLTAFVVLTLIVAGATVTSTDSGDAVPDWPLSYGTFMPPLMGGILYEHIHRLIAGLTGLLIAVLAIWLWFKEPRRRVRWIGLVAFLGVLLQAGLGGLRVLIVSTEAVQEGAIWLTGSPGLETARIAIAIAHAFLAQTVICIVFIIGVVTSKSWLIWQSQPLDGRTDRRVRWLSFGMAGLVFVQLVLGAVMRHTEAGLIIPDFPLSFGKIIPPFANLPHDSRAPFPISPEALRFKVAVHFLHRVFAFFILGMVFYLFITCRQIVQVGKLIKLLLALLIVQVFLGALNIWTANSVYSTVAHVLVGALILTGSVVFVLWTRLVPDVSERNLPAIDFRSGTQTLKSSLNESQTEAVETK